MSKKLCLMLLVCLAVVLVKSESSIEVDENGDEYEVKRFNIQGRQLNEGRSQCVVTRRKRSSSYDSAIKPEEADEDSNEDGNEDDVMANANAPLADAMLFYSPPADDFDGDEDDDDDDDEDIIYGNENTMNVNTKPKPLDLTANKDEDNDDDDVDSDLTSQNEDDYDEDGEGAETIEVVQLPQVPILGQLQSQGQSVAAIASSSSLGGNHGGYNHVSVSHHGHPAGTNGIMVVESHSPPKVNPNTHAVFELVAVNNDGHNGDAEANHDEDDEDDDEVDGDFDIEEELEPVTTTAIWSTGIDDDDIYDDLDNKPIKPIKQNNVVKKKPNHRPMNIKKTPTKRPLKPMRKNKKKNANKNNRVGGFNKNRVNNKRRPNRNGFNRRPMNKRKNNKMRYGNKTRRPTRRPTRRIVKKSRPVVDNTEKHDKKKTSISHDKKNKNRRANANKKDIAKKRKNKKNSLKKDQGENTYTRTVTMTQTDGSEDEPNTNCIFIRKDPPPTTARPFWNVLGRNANGARSSQFGQRKRANLRFKA